jgi:hypothetical protein
MRGSLLYALAVWERASAVVAPPVTSCDVWECCGYHRPLAETRDLIEDLVRRAPAGAGRELRRRVREADARMVGSLDGFWWRDPRYWT